MPAIMHLVMLGGAEGEGCMWEGRVGDFNCDDRHMRGGYGDLKGSDGKDMKAVMIDIWKDRT